MIKDAEVTTGVILTSALALRIFMGPCHFIVLYLILVPDPL